MRRTTISNRFHSPLFTISMIGNVVSIIICSNGCESTHGTKIYRRMVHDLPMKDRLTKIVSV